MERNNPNSSSHLQAIHRAPMYPQSIAAPASSLHSQNPSKPVETGLDAQQNGKRVVVPIEFVYVSSPNRTNNREASSHFEVPIYKKNPVGITPTAVEPVRQSSPGMAETQSKSHSVKALVFMPNEGRGQLMQKEVLASKDCQAIEVVLLKTEPGASAAAAVEKAKSRTEAASPSKFALGQTTGARKVESFPLGLTQEEKDKSKPEEVPTTETSGGPRNAPRKDQSREPKEIEEDINERASNFIRHTRMRIRTMSDAGGTEGATIFHNQR